MLLQLTSSRVAGAGLIEAGAGSLNIAAAVAVATTGSLAVETVVGGETIRNGLFAFSVESGTSADSFATSVQAQTIVWARHDRMG